MGKGLLYTSYVYIIFFDSSILPMLYFHVSVCVVRLFGPRIKKLLKDQLLMQMYWKPYNDLYTNMESIASKYMKRTKRRRITQMCNLHIYTWKTVLSHIWNYIEALAVKLSWRVCSIRPR